jgi:hypothetical protein
MIQSWDILMITVNANMHRLSQQLAGANYNEAQ